MSRNCCFPRFLADILTVPWGHNTCSCLFLQCHLLCCAFECAVGLDFSWVDFWEGTCLTVLALFVLCETPVANCEGCSWEIDLRRTGGGLGGLKQSLVCLWLSRWWLSCCNTGRPPQRRWSNLLLGHTWGDKLDLLLRLLNSLWCWHSLLVCLKTVKPPGKGRILEQHQTRVLLVGKSHCHCARGGSLGFRRFKSVILSRSSRSP